MGEGAEWSPSSRMGGMVSAALRSVLRGVFSAAGLRLAAAFSFVTTDFSFEPRVVLISPVLRLIFLAAVFFSAAAFGFIVDFPVWSNLSRTDITSMMKYAQR